MVLNTEKRNNILVTSVMNYMIKHVVFSKTVSIDCAL